MDFENRPYLTLSPAFSQIAEGGFAAVENCTWAALADTIFDYTGVRHQAPDLRLYDNQFEHLGAYGGGESWERNLRCLAALHPDLAADTVVEYPGDVVAALHDYGARGFMVHWAGWCTPGAQWITTRPSNSISHAGRLLAGQGGWLALWNVWSGYPVSQADAFWASAYDGGGLLVFKRSLRPAPRRPAPKPLWRRKDRMDLVRDIEKGQATLAQPWSISGPIALVGDEAGVGKRQTCFNVVATEQDTDLTFFVWRPDGTPVHQTETRTAKANDPNVLGPVPVFGGPAELGIDPNFGAFTLGLVILRGGPVRLHLHDEG